MNRQLIIIVEGKTDRRLLDKVAPPDCLIQDGAGKGAMRSFMEGFSYHEVMSRADFKKTTLGFRDRDFDFPMPAKAQLEQSSRKPVQAVGEFDIFVSHRRTLENYLILPATYATYFQSLSARSQQELPSPSAYIALLEEAAESIRAYQAIRAALGEVRRANAIGTSLLDARGEHLRSGNLPDVMHPDACLEGGLLVLARYAERARITADQQVLTRVFESYLDHFDAAFMKVAAYLEWFQGKDLKAGFNRIWNKEHRPFPWNSFETFAIDNFDHTQFPDLVEFRLILQQRLSQN